MTGLMDSKARFLEYLLKINLENIQEGQIIEAELKKLQSEITFLKSANTEKKPTYPLLNVSLIVYEANSILMRKLLDHKIAILAV